MNAILIKIFAVALALSQVTTKPDVKTEFDPVRDQAQAMRLLRDGCKHMLKVFDLENINIDELITIAMNDPQAVTAESKAFKGINFDDLAVAYREICKGDFPPPRQTEYALPDDSRFLSSSASHSRTFCCLFRSPWRLGARRVGRPGRRRAGADWPRQWSADRR